MRLASVLLLAACKTTIPQILDDDAFYPNTCQPTRFKCQAGCWWSGYSTYCNGGYTCKICARVGRGYYSPINDDKRYLCPSGRYSSIKQAASCSNCDPSWYNGQGSTYVWGNYCMLTSMKPSTKPSHKPSEKPRDTPSKQPSHLPSSNPSIKPFISTMTPKKPSKTPSIKPSKKPSTTIPSKIPSKTHSKRPTKTPSKSPSYRPFLDPSKTPSKGPMHQRISSEEPSHSPSRNPSVKPSTRPSKLPINMKPVTMPRRKTTQIPSRKTFEQHKKNSSQHPSRPPSCKPSKPPSKKAKQKPTMKPETTKSNRPSHRPIWKPSAGPSRFPLKKPSKRPSINEPSTTPSKKQQQTPSRKPFELPTKSPCRKPTKKPSETPLRKPIQRPKINPSSKPSGRPSGQQSSMPSRHISRHPSVALSLIPSSKPFLIILPKSTKNLNNHPSHNPSGGTSESNDLSRKPIINGSNRTLSPNPKYQTRSINPSSKASYSLPPSNEWGSTSPTKSAENPFKVECKAGFVGDRCDQCCDVYAREILKNGVLERNPECISSQGTEMEFYLAFGKCVECPGIATVLLKYVFFISLLLTISSCALCLMHNPRCVGMLNMSIKYLQFFSSLKYINVSWPTRISCAIQTVSVINFDSMTATFRCYFKVGHNRNLALMLTFPFVSSFLMSAFSIVARMILLKSMAGPLNWSFMSSIVMANMYYYFLQWCFTGIQHTLCEHDGANLMGSEYCHENNAAGKFGGKIHIILPILLVFGIPAVMIFALFAKVKRTKEKEIPDLPAANEDFHVCYRCFSWWYGPYKVEYWYWSIITLAEKMLLVILLSLFRGKIAVQIISILVILLATTVCEMVLLPFAYSRTEGAKIREKNASQNLLDAFLTNNNFISVALRLSLCSLLGCSLGLEKINNNSNPLRRSRKWVAPMMDFSALLGFATILTTVAVECSTALKVWWNKIRRSSKIVPIFAAHDSRMETEREIIDPFEVDNTLQKGCLLQGIVVCNGNVIQPESGQIASIESEIVLREESRRNLSLISESKMIEFCNRQPVRSSIVSSQVFTTIDDLPETEIKERESDKYFAAQTTVLADNKCETITPVLSINKRYIHRRDSNTRRGLGLRLYYPMGTQPSISKNNRECGADINRFRCRPSHRDTVEKFLLEDDQIGVSDAPQKDRRWYPINVQTREEKKGIGLRLYYPSGTHRSRGGGRNETETNSKKVL